MTAFKDTFQVYGNRRMLCLLGLGFSSGLPLALTSGTLQAWMTVEKVDLTLIGIFSLVGLPYTLKILWAPVMDRFSLPWLGRRRGWILLAQILLALGIGLLGLTQPAAFPWMVAFLAFMVAFFSSSQDIVIDAYRADVLPKTELGAGAAVSTVGYRLAMLVSGALALILSDHLPWSAVYAFMGGADAPVRGGNFLGPGTAGKSRPPEKPERSRLGTAGLLL